MTLFEVTRLAAREAVQMYFEPIMSVFGRFERDLLLKSFLRRHSSIASPAYSRRAVLPKPARRPWKALVVGRDSATRHLVSTFITSYGIHVDMVEDGDMAVGYLSQKAYNVLILFLPKLNELGTLEHLAEAHPDMLANTIVVTNVEVSEIRRLFPNVRDAFAKSVIPTHLIPAVRLCLESDEAEERQQTA